MHEHSLHHGHGHGRRREHVIPPRHETLHAGLRHEHEIRPRHGLLRAGRRSPILQEERYPGRPLQFQVPDMNLPHQT